MGNGHPVLGEGAGLVGADGGRGAEGLHGFQILHQAVFGGHALGSQGQAYSHSGQQALWHVGYDDTWEGGLRSAIVDNRNYFYKQMILISQNGTVIISSSPFTSQPFGELSTQHLEGRCVL